VKGKTGKSRVVSLNAEARAVALHQLSDATIRQFVFPSSKTKAQIKEVKKGLAGACKQAGISVRPKVLGGITFHTFRHWFRSRPEDLDVSKTVRRDLLGHEPKDMTDDYTHSTIEMRRRAVSLLCQTSSENVLNFSLNLFCFNEGRTNEPIINDRIIKHRSACRQFAIHGRDISVSASVLFWC
jgi:Phage integrase family